MGPARPCRERCEEDLSGKERDNRKSCLRFGQILVVGLCLLAHAMPSAKSAELLMFEAQLCEWCEVWDEEVGVVYQKTTEGRRAPLRRIALHEPRPPDLPQIDNVRFSPTFVLLDQGREVGRIVGYPGEDHFWGLLQALLDDLPLSSRSQTFGDM